MASKKPSTVKSRRDNRDPQALELWRGGASFDLIAKQLGFRDAEAAETSAIRELERSPSPDPEDLLRLELHRLDIMHMSLWPKARRGDVAAQEGILDIQKRRQRLRAASSISSASGEVKLLDAVEITVNALEDLDLEKDAAIIIAAKKVAQSIDELTKAGSDPELLVKATYATPHLVNILKEMLATPASRRQIAAASKEATAHGNRLLDYRDRARQLREGTG